jgi:hypothetical protein
MLREAEVALAQGIMVGEMCRKLSVSEQSYYRWQKQYGAMKICQVKRQKDIERENARLKKAVAELTLDKVILKEGLEGNYQAPTGVANLSRIYSKNWGYSQGEHVG